MAGRVTLLGIATAVVIGLAGCGGDGSSGTGEANSAPGPGASTNAVTIKDFAYTPISSLRPLLVFVSMKKGRLGPPDRVVFGE